MNKITIFLPWYWSFGRKLSWMTERGYSNYKYNSNTGTMELN